MDTKWIRNAAIFLIGQTVTLFGSSIVQFAIGWHITLTTKSGLMLTISTLCGFLPQLLISLFAGVWADRYNRRYIIIIADSVIAICTAALAVLYAMGHTELWLLFTVSVIRSLGAGVQMPAVTAFLTEIVPADKLMRVNGINASIMSVMLLVSPAAAGGLYGWLGLSPVFWVDVVTALIGVSLLYTLKIAPREKPQRTDTHFFTEMFSGMKYVKDTKWIRQLMTTYVFYALMFAPCVFLTPLMVARSFGPEPWRLVAHEMVFSAGSIFGGIAVGVWGGFRNKIHTLLAACGLFGLTTFIMGFSPNFWFYLGVMLPMGVTMPFINTSWMTVLQTKVAPEYIGRVFGVSSIIGSAAMPLSMVFFGPLADVMSVEHQLIITGAAMTVIPFFMLKLKDMVAAGEPDAPANETEVVYE